MARQARPWYNAEKNWWMVTLGGTRHKLARGKKNKKAADLRFHELQILAAKNPHPDCPEQTVASVIDTYQTFAKRRLGEGTLEIRLPYQQSFAEAHGWRLISEAKPLHMLQWLDAHSEWASDWTKSSAVRNVQVAFNWAVKTRLIAFNPFAGVSHRPGEPRRNITREEFQALLRSSSSGGGRKKLTPAARFRMVLIFLWFTGARPSEASRLKWSDVNLDVGQIVLQNHKTRRTQRTLRPRVIFLHPVIVKLLKVIRGRDEGEHVFLTCRHTPWNRNNLSHRLRRARDKAGLPDDAKLYGTRHAFGTRAIAEGGVDIKTLAELMGHATTRMTEHYLHLAGQKQHLAGAMLAATPPRRDC